MKRLIGAHVSAAGGVENAVTKAAAMGANCVQVFSGSPRVWQRKPLDQINVDKVFSKQRELSVSSIFTHALYLVNLASEKPELREKSVRVLKHDLSFDSLLKGSGVVVHVGSHQGRGWEAVREQVATSIKEILDDSPADSTFLIENAASHNGKVGNRLEEIRWLLDAVKSPRLGWCADTCHLHAAGYALGEVKSSDQVASATSKEKTAIEEITDLDLWSTLKCLHVNDSKDPFASGRDRHQNIGAGVIPTADLKYFLTYNKAKDIPIITEVPGLDGTGPDEENINRIKALVLP
ncbi:MAG TPA: deoxyribonuclease IV [Patescibacteria group bacterium]